MLNTKEQRELERLLKKQQEPEPPITEDDLDAIESRIAGVYDRSPDLFGDGMAAYRNFCKNLEIIASDNDRLVREVRRLQSALSEREDEPKETPNE